MEVGKDRIRQLNDEILSGVSGGLETKLPLKIAVVTDDAEEKDKKDERKKHEID